MFNGENYLIEALESILAQTYGDYELIISDNASTDRTMEICQAYVAKDPRIRYFRNTTNIGGAGNFNKVFKLSSGEYFKWAAHDDVIGREFISECVKVLDADPSIVLCFPRSLLIDGSGSLGKKYPIEMRMLRFDSEKPYERFRDFISIYFPVSIPIFGLIRASVLQKTSLFNSYSGSDRNLMVEIGLQGRFFEIPKYLLYERDHQERASNKYSFYNRGTWFDPTRDGHITLPTWRRGFEYLKDVRRAQLTHSERLRCYAAMGYWYQAYKEDLVLDLIRAAKLSLRPFIPKVLKRVIKRYRRH